MLMKRQGRDWNVEGIYLDTDCIPALIKDADWLKDDVRTRINGDSNLFTSIITVIECKLVISREEDGEMIYDIQEKIISEKIKILPLNGKIEKYSNILMKKYNFLGIFDSIHSSTAIFHELKMISTDHVFPLIKELYVENPRCEPD